MNNGDLAAGTYTVTYSASGYENVTQTLFVTDPSDTAAPKAPTVKNVTGNSSKGYTVQVQLNQVQLSQLKMAVV